MNHALNIQDYSCQRSIRVRGIVQGVGFRPTVWRYANTLGLSGYVLNDGEGVIIECKGSLQKINQLIEQLHNEPPLQARITDISEHPSDAYISGNEFRIVASNTNTGSHTSISPDLATCPECLAEIMNVNNRRYQYPFTNCIHCGPRLSIIQQLPYDRANTSMASFQQCAACQAEYENPADRRFHAQPNACPHCGPALAVVLNESFIQDEFLPDRDDKENQGSDVITIMVTQIKAGKIVALKGVGGFQLVADAENPLALQALRERKQRPDKPFALMARDLQVIGKYCHIETFERELLESPAAPIVLLKRCKAADPSSESVLAGVAPAQNRLGFMLPTSPLHHLLLAGFDQPLVMTSGNPSGEPQCIDNDRALRRLAAVADSFIVHDREILHRVDDSVVQVIDGQQQMLRRARGYAPAPLSLPDGFADGPDILAMGAELKNTFCLLRDGHAVMSQHIGDLQDAVTLADFESNLALYTEMYEHQPEVVAVDQHAQYLASQIGQQLAGQQAVPIAEVQHHHAHIAACLGDNMRPLTDGPVLGVALDGLGIACNNGEAELWGGEILLADYCRFTHLGRLKPVALPGGHIAMGQPWRNCLAHLHAAVGWQKLSEQYAELPLVQSLKSQSADTLIKMIDNEINSPLSSSCGRLFDAAAAALGINQQGEISFEGQAAMAMEATISDTAWQDAAPWPMVLSEQQGLTEIDPTPLWTALLEDLTTGGAPEIMAASFYKSLVVALAEVLQRLATSYQLSTVALSGGCFQSPRLQSALSTELTAAGLAVLTHHQVPANDGGLSFGQALVAAAQMKSKDRGNSLCV